MDDVIFISIIILFFLLSFLFIRFFDSIMNGE